eukprot:CAMPEP_0172608262 /NCGR_PEP_ID=MMETSP1068-20121228/28367_1 /TAXON_ID=35684 /ORGANISM="Pseudopedinella elastica, Strain CCMP716" /LENGTH=240 /DNA_ID=CAMNT_0013411481 /DNA_START=58 /DNA_END=777 /DNA_ORIENTATION=-
MALATIEDLFKECGLEVFVEKFKDVSGATELADLLESTNEELDEALGDLGLKAMQRKRLLRHIAKARADDASLSPPGSPPPGTLSSSSPTAAAAAAEAGLPRAPDKRYAAYLACDFEECATEAMLVQLQLQLLLPGQEIFLDSEGLVDLPSAMQAVRESGCLVYLDSASYLTRSARGVLELYAAAQARVPVVAIRLVGPRTPFTPFHPPRSAGWTLGYLRWLDDKERGLDSWAPGSGGVC